MLYIDTPRSTDYRHFSKTAHLISTDRRSELIDAIQDHGMNAEWIQEAGTYREHFDVFDGRCESIREDQGVNVVRSTDLVRIMKARFDSYDRDVAVP